MESVILLLCQQPGLKMVVQNILKVLQEIKNRHMRHMQFLVASIRAA